jgi:hypothetical protein
MVEAADRDGRAAAATGPMGTAETAAASGTAWAAEGRAAEIGTATDAAGDIVSAGAETGDAKADGARDAEAKGDDKLPKDGAVKGIDTTTRGTAEPATAAAIRT